MSPSLFLRSPCKTCPYRRSTRLAFWSIAEFQNLIAQNSRTLGSPFGCHQDSKKPGSERRACAGWLIDQKRHGTPSLNLRIMLFKYPRLARYYERLKDLGAKLYDNVEEMFETNYPGGKPRPMQPKEKR